MTGSTQALDIAAGHCPPDARHSLCPRHSETGKKEPATESRDVLPNDENKDSERSSQNIRTRQSVLDEISARPKSTRPSSAQESQPARKTLSTHRTPRNVPVSLREPPARSYGFAQSPSSPRPTSRNVQSGASDAARDSHPVQPHPHGQTSHSGLRDSAARSYGSAQPRPRPGPRRETCKPARATLPRSRTLRSPCPPSRPCRLGRGSVLHRVPRRFEQAETRSPLRRMSLRTPRKAPHRPTKYSLWQVSRHPAWAGMRSSPIRISQ